MKKRKNNSNKLYNLIKRKYTDMGYITLPQVRNHAGSDNIRTADAIAISQSSLRSVEFVGFEIKTSVKDFRNELKDVKKADEIAQFCNKWYIVSPKDVIPKSELPKNWGLLEATDKQLKITKEALELDSTPPSREFVATIIRRVEKEIGMKDEYWRGYEEGKAQEKKMNQERFENHKKDYNKMKESIDAFEKSSGVNFYWWNGGEESREIGNIVKLISENRLVDRIEHAKKTVSELAENIEMAQKELKKWSNGTAINAK